MKQKSMMRIFALTLVFLLTACTKTAPEQAMVYSFSGEKEQLSIRNGRIVVSDTSQTFYGGNLTLHTDHFSAVSSYTTTFYTISGTEKRIILSNSVADVSGQSITIHEDLGQISGADAVLPGAHADQMAHLKDHLYFELIAIGADGEETACQLRVSVTEVTP